jgi:Protein of unknown function (DUF1176)
MIRIAFAVFAAVSLCATARAADAIKIPFPVVQAAFKKAECTIELQDEERTEVEVLGGGLKIVEICCWRAAYQAGSIFLAVDSKVPAKARLLRFNEWDNGKKRLIAVYALSNPSFDSTSKTMHMGHKGRGMGDCGVVGHWKWTGRDFMLTRFFSKPDCDGQPFDDDRKWQVYPPR